MNAVDSLWRCPFTLKAFEKKTAIVAVWRPKPKLEQLIEINKHAKRRFSVAKYEKYDWLTGSELKNRMFCWTCLLFSNERTGPWVKEALSSLSSFCKKAKVYANSSAHIKATITASITLDDIKALDEFLQRRLHHVCPNRWNYSMRRIW